MTQTVQPELAKKPQALLWPALTIGAILMTTLIALKLESQPWYCACGKFEIWKSSVWSSHCSQHPLDPYSITHMSHGLIFWCVFLFIPKLRTLSVAWRLALATFIAAAWEVAENSPFVINRYRTVTMSLDYLGDSVTNAMMDVVCCMLGFFVARKLGVKKTLLFFAATEIALLFLVRDNLTLNVIMLISPVDAIKQWQMGAAPPGLIPQ